MNGAPTVLPAVRARRHDLLRFSARLGRRLLRRRREGDAAALVQQWAREVAARGQAAGVELSLFGRRVRLVADRDASDRILAAPPAAGGCPAGRFKIAAMRFLAPHALTIAEGEAWTRLRAFNERVLATARLHPFAAVFLARTRAAFALPVSSKTDLRDAMGRAMEGILFGDAAAGRGLAEQARTLFDVVLSPLRRALVGFLYRRRRARFYAQLGELWDEAPAGEPTLLSLARHPLPGTAAEGSRGELLEQLPHWMFTFTGSGTTLLALTLALIGARPAARARVVEEIAAAGDPATVGRMPFLRACLLEAGRLYPPVARTFHRCAAEKEVEIAHDFSLLQRDGALGETVHAFHPERWLAPQVDAAARASNLFLRGPRACPGADLILFVCTAAAALLLGERGLVAHDERLAKDPLPLTSPRRPPRFAALDR